jgi:hypothetical protein
MENKFRKKINPMNRNRPLFGLWLHGVGQAQQPLRLGRPKPGGRGVGTPMGCHRP